MLAEEQREAIFPLVTSWCRDWSVGHADAGGVRPARDDRRAAACRAPGARRSLRRRPTRVLLDGSFDYLTEPDEDGTRPSVTARPAVRTVVRGDAACVSIAAASIVAKVTRDRMMRSLAPSFPAFDFDRNKGYPSRVHRTALAGFGLTSIHRRSWAFVDGMAFR